MQIVKQGAHRRAPAKGWKHWAMTPLLAMLAGGTVLASLTTGPAAGAAVAAPAPPAHGVNLSAAAASASGVYLAYTGTDRQVYVLNAAAPGQARIALGGQLVSGPALAVVPAGVLSTGQVLAVFGRGTDNALWWRHQTTAGSGSWTGWQSLGGNITSKPAVVINGSNQFGALNVVAAGTTGRIWYRVYSSGLARVDRAGRPAGAPGHRAWRRVRDHRHQRQHLPVRPDRYRERLRQLRRAEHEQPRHRSHPGGARGVRARNGQRAVVQAEHAADRPHRSVAARSGAT